MAYGECAVKKPFLSSTGSSREGQEDLMITQEVGSLKKCKPSALRLKIIGEEELKHCS